MQFRGENLQNIVNVYFQIWPMHFRSCGQVWLTGWSKLTEFWDNVEDALRFKRYFRLFVTRFFLWGGICAYRWWWKRRNKRRFGPYFSGRTPQIFDVYFQIWPTAERTRGKMWMKSIRWREHQSNDKTRVWVNKQQWTN